jgi:hypothetical protein
VRFDSPPEEVLQQLVTRDVEKRRRLLQEK